jgi:hypothetical protein
MHMGSDALLTLSPEYSGHLLSSLPHNTEPSPFGQFLGNILGFRFLTPTDYKLADGKRYQTQPAGNESSAEHQLKILKSYRFNITHKLQPEPNFEIF